MSIEKREQSDVDYRVGDRDRHCGVCTMWRYPGHCTAVVDPVNWYGLCDLFVDQAWHKR